MGTTDFDSFERLYQGQQDPWDFLGSSYEQEKYAMTLRCLRKARYGRVFEPACAEGVLTRKLAARCEELIAMDVSPTAAERARQRCASLAHVEILTGDITKALPPGRFDLVVFSELGYYFSKGVLSSLTSALALRLRAHGELIAVHWLGRSADHTLTGDEVHEELRQCLPLAWIRGERHESYRIDLWQAP